MNINAFRKGDFKISPTAKYFVDGKEFTAKEFKEYIGSEEAQDAEPGTTDTTAKETTPKKRRSSVNTVRDSATTVEQTASDV